MISVENDIYSFKSYKKYILSWIKSQPQNGRGMLSKIAKQLRTQSSFVSQVFSGNLDLSKDQAYKLCEMLKLDENGINYFLILVDLSRAGTSALKSHLNKEMKRQQELAFKARIKGADSLVLAEEDQQIYYSSWYYSVIHIALTIKKFQSYSVLAQVLGLDISLVEKTIDYLISKDLIRNKNDGTFEIGASKIHLDWNSKSLAKHHSNYRLFTLNSIEKGPELEKIHYSSVISLSHEDVHSLRDQLSEQIKSVREKVKQSYPSDELICFNLDFFKIG